MIRTSMLMFGSTFFMFRLNVQFGKIVLCAFPMIVVIDHGQITESGSQEELLAR